MKTDKQATLELITRQVDVMRVGQSVGMGAVKSLAKAQAEIELLCDAADWGMRWSPAGISLRPMPCVLETSTFDENDSP